ncbi:putative 1-phosphatidylinositol-3-phosphate 5-kinase FAB1C [Silene latifolia]|uniref:putative 1-phosphatidylinositol-3-phosphate 5-kinase FAB1C n=1 Tax=Silene latifolia TaxID=37657 RepID=UPI003D77E9F0
MGVPDNSLIDLIHKVRSWASWGKTNLLSFSAELDMAELDDSGCCGVCELKGLCELYSCLGCRRRVCVVCARIGVSSEGLDGGDMERVVKVCKFCYKLSKRHIEKIYPSESPRRSPEPLSPGILGDKLCSGEDCKGLEEQNLNCSPHKKSSNRSLSYRARPLPNSLHHSPIQSDDEPEDSQRHFFSSASDYYHDSLDIDISSVSFRSDCYSFKSTGSSPLDSPSRFNINTPRAGQTVSKTERASPKRQDGRFASPERMAVLRKPHQGTQDLVHVVDGKQNEKVTTPLDFENNSHIWLPPPPEDDEAENYFEYDDDDDDNVAGVSGGVFSSSKSLSNLCPPEENQHVIQKEPFNALIQGHFRALVSQLLQGEGIKAGKEDEPQDWLDIVSTLAWQAANFVKPDTSRGGSMDPGNYVKIKCIASGSPSESTLIKGVVCTKNIKHKRMTSQYKSPRLLLLGGSLEYQRAQNQLASFDNLLEEEMNHLKMIVSKIEAHRPNVLLVEKSVSSYAQEYLLTKEISLVLNVKRPLLERIARCTGALITPSVDKISTARLGHCQLFRIEKVSEEHEAVNQSSKRPSKTLMYFEGCPRRLGCTVLLKGLCREELKKVKHVLQYAVFAAHHLSLETSFLADEGAHIPKMAHKQSFHSHDHVTADIDTFTLPSSDAAASSQEDNDGFVPRCASAAFINNREDQMMSNDSQDLSGCGVAADLESSLHDSIPLGSTEFNSGQPELPGAVFVEDPQLLEVEKFDENEVSSDYLAATDNQQSILVSFSSRCVSKGALCERSRLLRIRFYGSFDKPLGRYLRDDLFDQASVCRSCKEPVEAHVQCYTHRQGVLSINVRRIDTSKLPGERDGKIWMWHRCLRCDRIDSVPPATRRIIMSDAAWGLSFGKFLELSFSNHATANRVASCGHSIQRDCLRFYGFGSMVAFFHYSPIDILTVHLPPSVLEFNGSSTQDWIQREVEELQSKIETLHGEVVNVLHVMEQKSTSLFNESADSTDLHKHILELKEILDKETDEYYGLLQQATEDNFVTADSTIDIFELNRLRRSLVTSARAWDRQLYSLDSLLNSKSFKFESTENATRGELKELNNDDIKNSKFNVDQSENGLLCTESQLLECSKSEEVYGEGETTLSEKSSEGAQSPVSNLSDKIDSAWTGTEVDASQAFLPNQVIQVDNLPIRRLMAPVRVHSFDSATRLQEKLHRKLLTSSHLSAVRSFHVSGDPASRIVRTYSQVVPNEAQFAPSFVSSMSLFAERPRLLLPQIHNDLVVAVYDDEPTSVISYALSSKEYENWVSDSGSQNDGSSSGRDFSREDSSTSTFLSWQSFGSSELDYISYGNYASEDSVRNNMPLSDLKRSPHLQISFGDDSSTSGGKAKFSTTCYYAKQFDMLREKCCPSKVDFVHSLSRCRRWTAQGGKSNVYFAKSMDDRFIIKQVTKTELDSFQEFAVEYFKYLNDSLDSGSPTCLAKVLGIFQVTIKHVKGGRETKMDLMVMENLFFNRRISRVYDLKGSSRSRYNTDKTGANKVLLDMNLLETLRTNPIFLGSKAKRRLERAVWNDTSFLASVDVMDYSLLVGVDEERKELVLGIIDFMRQYTWDKHLETWVKASGLLGGPKNVSPTIVSPKQYKRRFRKAMTTYFLTVPDQWSS